MCADSLLSSQDSTCKPLSPQCQYHCRVVQVLSLCQQSSKAFPRSPLKKGLGNASSFSFSSSLGVFFPLNCFCPFSFCKRRPDLGDSTSKRQQHPVSPTQSHLSTGGQPNYHCLLRNINQFTAKAHCNCNRTLVTVSILKTTCCYFQIASPRGRRSGLGSLYCSLLEELRHSQGCLRQMLRWWLCVRVRSVRRLGDQQGLLDPCKMFAWQQGEHLTFDRRH